MTTVATETHQSKAPTLTATQRDWLEHLQKQHASGLSMAAYARSQGMAIHTFYYWAQRLRGRQPSQAGTPVPLLQPVTLVAPHPPVASAEFVVVFRLPNRMECELRPTDVHTLSAVVQALAQVSL